MPSKPKMKLFTCMAHADPRKLPYLAPVLKMQALLCESVHVCIITNLFDPAALSAIHACAPPLSERFTMEIYNHGCDQLPSPWLLTWVHKKLMLEKFRDPSYTHFMCIEDDMEVTPANMRYWLHNREVLRPYNLYPSFLRVEWNTVDSQWAMTDSELGDSYSISKSPRLNLDGGHHFINLPKSYQGIFLYDRELMQEHIDAVLFDLFQFIPDWQNRILNAHWPLCLTEAAVFGLTYINVNPGCYSRNFLPFFPKYRMVDPQCFVHHLPDKYTNMPESTSGKVYIRDMLAP